MSDTLVAIFMGAGVAAWVYSRFARRIGYGNNQSVWTTIGIVFVLTFAVVFTLLKYVVHLH